MMDTPVWVSPLSTAHCTGAEPRYLGSSDTCRLMQPYRATCSSCGGRMQPYATTTMTSGARLRINSSLEPSRKVRGW